MVFGLDDVSPDHDSVVVIDACGYCSSSRSRAVNRFPVAASSSWVTGSGFHPVFCGLDCRLRFGGWMA